MKCTPERIAEIKAAEAAATERLEGVAGQGHPMTHRHDIDPEDHGAYMVRCSRCGVRYHCTDNHECPFPSDHGGGDYNPPLDWPLDEPSGQSMTWVTGGGQTYFVVDGTPDEVNYKLNRCQGMSRKK